LPDSDATILKHDNDDDGEDGAGSRLAHLLEMRKEDGVLVVVSRWFGGIHLGKLLLPLFPPCLVRFLQIRANAMAKLCLATFCASEQAQPNTDVVRLVIS